DACGAAAVCGAASLGGVGSRERRRGRRRYIITHGHELRDDLPRLEIARKAELSGRAEVAAHRATGLARETNGEASFTLERNSHRLRERAIIEAEEGLHETV